MIRKKSLDCKLKNTDFHVLPSFERFMKQFVPQKEQCPFCGAVSQCEIYSSYGRFVMEYSDGVANAVSLTITRVKCKSCGHTHAILPDFIIPYLSISLPMALAIMKDYFSHEVSIEGLCRKYQIAVRTLYRLKRQFLLHKEEWQGILASLETLPCAFLESVANLASYSFSAWEFLLKTTFSFLQSHANPANCRHPILPASPP